MKSKYLEELQIKKDSKEIDNHEKEHYEKYGVYYSDSFNLDYTISEYLYCQLKNYLHHAEKIIDLNFYKFDVKKLKSVHINEENNRPMAVTYMINLTQKECVELCIEYLKEYLLDEEKEYDNVFLGEFELGEKRRIAFEIFSQIIDCMWW